MKLPRNQEKGKACLAPRQTDETAKRPNGADERWEVGGRGHRRVSGSHSPHDMGMFTHPADATEVSRNKAGGRPLANTSGVKSGTYITSQELLQKYEIYNQKNVLKAYKLNLISPLGNNKNSYLTDKLIRQTQKHNTYPSQWLIFMVTRCSIIGCVYSGKLAINMLEKTIFRDGENVQEQELTHCF